MDENERAVQDAAEKLIGLHIRIAESATEGKKSSGGAEGGAGGSKGKQGRVEHQLPQGNCPTSGNRGRERA